MIKSLVESCAMNSKSSHVLRPEKFACHRQVTSQILDFETWSGKPEPGTSFLQTELEYCLME